MKLRTLLLVLISLSFIATLFGENYGSEILETVQGTGIVKLNGTSVTNTLHVNGSLIAQNAQIGTLDVLGEANLTGSTIKNSASIMGSLQAVRTTFEQSITVLCQRVVFTASHLEGLTVQQDGGFKGKQVVELKQSTIVNGPIHFESGKGEVVLYPGSQVLGPITGGKLIKKSY